jgi:hypothetical protein
LSDSRRSNGELRLINALNPSIYLKTLYPNTKSLNNYQVNYDRGSLITAVKLIAKAEDISMEVKQQKVFIEVGFGINITQGEVSVRDWFANDYTTKLAYTPVFNFKIMLPKRLSIFSGIHYNSRKITSAKEITFIYYDEIAINRYYKYKGKPDIKTSCIEFPFIVRYDVFRKKGYYAGLGSGFYLITKRKISVTNDFGEPSEIGVIYSSNPVSPSYKVPNISYKSGRRAKFSTNIDYLSSVYFGRKFNKKSAIEASLTFNSKNIDEHYFISTVDKQDAILTSIYSRRLIFSLNYYYRF